ncbi:MAG: hypothetical protein WDA24_06175 [Tissierellales bacterium]
MYECLSNIRNYYGGGFKCIKYEYNLDGEFVIYLKNFESEEIKTLYCIDKKESNEIKNFIDLS